MVRSPSWLRPARPAVQDSLVAALEGGSTQFCYLPCPCQHPQRTEGQRKLTTDGPRSGPEASIASLAPGLLRRALRGGGDFADLYYEQTRRHGLTLRQEMRGGRIHPPVRRGRAHAEEGLGIRVLGETGSGFAATEDLSLPALKTLADRVGAHAAGQPRRAAVPTGWHRQDGPPLPADAPDRVGRAEKEHLLAAAADAALGLDRYVRRVSAAYQDCVRHVLIATSEGRIVTKASMLVGLRVEVELERGGRHVTGQAVGGGAYGFGHFFAHPVEEIAQAAVASARRRAAAATLRSGPMPVVIAGGWGGVWLHEAVGHLLEADTESPLIGRLGAPVAASGVTLVDDPTLPGGRASAPFDDEGTPTARRPLIEDGTLRGLLADRLHARRLECMHTGSARRQDFRHAPLPRMSNLLLLPGSAAPEDLIAAVPDGLFVRTVGQGVVFPDRRRFSCEVLEGTRIERGRLTTPVADVRLTGRVPDVLTGLRGIGRDFGLDAARGMCEKAGQVVPVSVGMPTVLVYGLEVGHR